VLTRCGTAPGREFERGSLALFHELAVSLYVFLSVLIINIAHQRFFISVIIVRSVNDSLSTLPYWIVIVPCTLLLLVFCGNDAYLFDQCFFVYVAKFDGMMPLDPCILLFLIFATMMSA
jgi:hypothetical protein